MSGNSAILDQEDEGQCPKHPTFRIVAWKKKHFSSTEESQSPFCLLNTCLHSDKTIHPYTAQHQILQSNMFSKPTVELSIPAHITYKMPPAMITHAPLLSIPMALPSQSLHILPVSMVTSPLQLQAPFPSQFFLPSILPSTREAASSAHG